MEIRTEMRLLMDGPWKAETPTSSTESVWIECEEIEFMEAPLSGAEI